MRPRKLNTLLKTTSIHAALFFAAFLPAIAQTAVPKADAAQTAPQSNESQHGTVLFQSHGEPPAAQPEMKTPQQWNTAEKSTGQELTDAERSAVLFTAYDLDVRLKPASAGLSARARVSLLNTGKAPLTQIALQISSTLQWESANLFAGSGTKLDLAQHLIDTDADHTGKANEAVLKLPAPLRPGESLTLDTFYSGTIPVSTGRLQRLGASQSQALGTDWDGIRSGYIALRGFGNVLWYPVAAPQLFLGQGAELFDAIGQTEAREQGASMRFRVGVEYEGDPPVAAYFCGRRQPLVAQSDSPDFPIATGTGIATAEFPAQVLGFRLPSLIVVDRQEALLAPLPSLQVQSSSSSSSSSSAEFSPPQVDSSADVTSGTSGEGAPMLAVESDDSRALPPLISSAQQIAPLLERWLGSQPLSALTVIDNTGQPFEDGPLLLAPIGSLVASTEQPALAHSLTHAWVQTGQPWMDEGLAQFFALLWTERVQGRDAALLQLNNLMQPVSLAEPNIEAGEAAPAGQPLIAASSELFFRRKASAVWFMLREVAGEPALKAALRAWRMQPLSHTPAEEQARAFETLLEKQSGKSLRWFFDDWVLRDRGLPDLAITDTTTRLLPSGKGHNSGWLVAVTVHNEGAAAAEVPVVVRSGAFSTTSRLLIPGFENATARVLVETAPTQVVVNDGSVPEIQNVRHVREIVAAAEPAVTPAR